MPNQLIRIENRTTSQPVCTCAERANTFFTRLRGLLGTDGIRAGGGLLLEPSSGVHTFGMRFDIDVVALDRDLRVLGIWQHMRPGRVRTMSRRTHAVLELSSGAAAQSGLHVGDLLVISPAS